MMRNPFENILKKRATSDGVVLDDALLQALISPDSMTLKKAMSIPAFAGCVNIICNTAKIIPLRLYRYEGKDKDRVVPVLNDRRTSLLNSDTGDTLSGPNFKGIMVYDYLTGRGGYAYIDKPGVKVAALCYVEPGYISILEGADHIHKDYKIAVDGREYEPHQFLKLLRRTKNGYRGIPIVEENAKLLSAAYNAILLEDTLIRKGGNKRGFIKSQKNLTQEAVNSLQKAIYNMYSGEGTPVLNNGLDFQETSSTSVELQMNENKKQNGTEICKIFGVPPRILEGGATDADWTAFIQYTMIPIMEDFSQALNRDLLLEREKGKLFWAPDVSELTKGDIQKRFEAYKTAVSSGFLQIDEVRKMENLASLNLPFTKLGLQDVLLDPESGDIYTPNTGMWGSLKAKTSDSDASPPAPQGVPPDDEPGERTDEPEPEEPVPKGGETP